MYELSAVNTAPFALFLTRRKNIWYSINDGNWSNPNTWISTASHRRNITIPQPGDDIYINHTVTADLNSPSFSYVYNINNLYVQGSLILSGAQVPQIFYINGDLQVNGILDMSNGLKAHTLYLLGVNNYVVNFIPGYAMVDYCRQGDQQIMNLSYCNLGVHGIGTKYLSSDLTIGNNLSINDYQPYNAFLECGPFDLTVNGTSYIFADGYQADNSIDGAGNMLFVGPFNSNSNFNISAAANIEFRGGGAISGFGGNATINGKVNFTTYSQTISGAGLVFNGNVTVTGAITVTITNGSYAINGIWNGTVPASTLANSGILYLGTPTLPMALTGIFDYNNTATSTIGFMFDGNYTLPYTSFAGNLLLQGTGTKALMGDTSIAGNLVVSNFTNSGTLLNCGGYHLTVDGTAACLDQFAGILSSGGGNLTFGGLATFDCTGHVWSSTSTVEFKNGLNFGGWGQDETLDANLLFTTNDQTWISGAPVTLNGSVTISGGITLTASIGLNINSCNILSGILNGSSNDDVFSNTAFIIYANATAPMVTGKLYCNQATNTFVYSAAGNQDIQIPSDPTNPGYSNLTLAGSGAKRLLGNVAVKGTYTLTAPATLNTNGFTLTNP